VAEQPGKRVIVRTHRSGGVWHVTCDGQFLGDYMSEAVAQTAARDAVREIERQGGAAELLCGPSS
jgi:hypothetical protein